MLRHNEMATEIGVMRTAKLRGRAVALGVWLPVPCLAATVPQAGGPTIQLVALVVFLAFTAAIVAVFLWTARTTRAPREADVAAAYRLRRILFVSAVALLSAVVGFTLPRSPYPDNDVIAERVVYVTVQQFSFTFTSEPVTTLEDLGNVELIDSLELPAATMIEFRVTSLDVNHGFGIYNSEGVLVGQTQAMPGYVNRLRLRFDQPGRYEVLCLEFCGLAHHLMRNTFTINRAAEPARG